jgi:hypothetical protein
LIKKLFGVDDFSQRSQRILRLKKTNRKGRHGRREYSNFKIVNQRKVVPEELFFYLAK